MRILGISSIFLLTACILSFSLTGAVNAQSDQVPLSVEVNLPEGAGYTEGNELIVSGDVSLNKNVDINSRLYVVGDSSFNSNVYILKKLNVSEDVSLNSNTDISNLYVINNVEISNNLTVNNNALFKSTVDICGNLNLEKLIATDASFSNYVDISGNLHCFSRVDLDDELVIGNDKHIITKYIGKVDSPFVFFSTINPCISFEKSM